MKCQCAREQKECLVCSTVLFLPHMDQGVILTYSFFDDDGGEGIRVLADRLGMSYLDPLQKRMMNELPKQNILLQLQPHMKHMWIFQPWH